MKTVIAKNITASGINIDDLSGVTIPASGTRNLSDQFEFYRLVTAEDLLECVASGTIVINDGTRDLSATEAALYISYDDATSLQQIPIVDPDISTPYGGYTVRYDAGQLMFDFDTYTFNDMPGTIISDNGVFYIVNASGTSQLQIRIPFTNLTDVPTSYSGSYGDLLMVSTSGIVFSNPLEDIAYFRYAEDNNESYSTSITYVSKLTLTVSGVPSGTYRTSWYYEFNYPTSSFAMFTRVQMDDLTVLGEVAQRAMSASDWFAASGFGYISITGDYHHIDLDYRSDKVNTAAGIRRARLELRRITRDE